MMLTVIIAILFMKDNLKMILQKDMVFNIMVRQIKKKQKVDFII